MAEYLTMRYEKDGIESFIKHLSPPKRYRISKSDTQLLSVGLFYVEKNRQCEKVISVANEISMKSDLCNKLKVMFKSFPTLKSVRMITTEGIQIIKFDGGTRADVICSFCPPTTTDMKKFAVQYDPRSNEKSHYWNTSNYKRHIRAHVTAKENNKDECEKAVTKTIYDQSQAHIIACEQNIDIDTDSISLSEPIKQRSTENGHAIDSCADQTILLLPIIDDSDMHCDKVNDNAIITNDSNPCNTLYKQFAAQNVSMLEAALMNCERCERMEVYIGDQMKKINVVPIQQDGNCLFSTLIHQLEGVETMSCEHVKRTDALRQQIVQHIKKHQGRFKSSIMGSVIGNVEMKKMVDKDMDKACADFLENL